MVQRDNMLQRENNALPRRMSKQGVDAPRTESAEALRARLRRMMSRVLLERPPFNLH